MQTRITCALAACLLSLSAFAIAGCGDESGDSVELSCNLEFSGANIEGDWSLSAHGRRTKCSDRRLQGDLTITSEEPLIINSTELDRDASASVADAFVNRIIERSGFDLAGKSLPARITFSGGTDGSCVAFTLTEDLGKGDELSYDFEGTITDDGVIEGSFTGTGPDDCETSGRFRVELN